MTKFNALLLALALTQPAVALPVSYQSGHGAYELGHGVGRAIRKSAERRRYEKLVEIAERQGKLTAEEAELYREIGPAALPLLLRRLGL